MMGEGGISDKGEDDDDGVYRDVGCDIDCRVMMGCIDLSGDDDGVYKGSGDDMELSGVPGHGKVFGAYVCLSGLSVVSYLRPSVRVSPPVSGVSCSPPAGVLLLRLPSSPGRRAPPSHSGH